MAKFSDVNRDTTANGGGEVLYRIMTTKVAAGWTIKASGDGLAAYDPVGGTAITGPGAGANGMNNTKAWFRAQDPATRREFTWMRGSTTTSVRVKYSALDKFTGGAPSATVTPSATDEQILSGGGTDAVPTYSTVWANAGTYKAHVIAQSTPEGGVYGFWAFTTTAAFATAGGTFFCEPLIAGSYPALDADPCLVNAATTTGSGYLANAPGVSAWYKMNLAGETFVIYAWYGVVNIAGAGTSLFGSGFSGVNPYDGDINAVPIGTGRGSAATQPGWKGFTKYLRLKGTANVYPDTVNLATDAYVFVDIMLVPWPDGVVPT